jgi:ribonuclease-3
VDRPSLETCQEALGYTFDDPGLLYRALTHSSVARTRAESNERLEFLGDAVLGLVVCNELYDHADELTEGDMTKVKSTVVSRQTCAAMVRHSGLDQLMLLGKGMGSSGGPPESVLGAVFESLVGAIYLDGGLEPARAFVLTHARPYMDKALESQHRRNYKSLLQQHAQRKWSVTPEYDVLDEKGPDHSKCFEVGVSINGKTFPSAWGRCKKDAEQAAARRALEDLGIVDPEDEAPGDAPAGDDEDWDDYDEEFDDEYGEDEYLDEEFDPEDVD